MKDISNKCIFSGKSENLAITMTVNVGGEDWKVSVSSEYEDNATPSSIKKIIQTRIQELDDLKVKAEALGMMLVPKNYSPPPTSSPPAPTQVAQKPHKSQISDEAARAAAPKTPEELANKATKRDLQQVAAQSGRPLFLPKTEVGPGGTTEIQIIQTTDKELKSMVDKLNRDDTPSIGKKYTIRDCGSCRGTGKKGTAICVQCKGRGIIA